MNLYIFNYIYKPSPTRYPVFPCSLYLTHDAVFRPTNGRVHAVHGRIKGPVELCGIYIYIYSYSPTGPLSIYIPSPTIQYIYVYI